MMWQCRSPGAATILGAQNQYVQQYGWAKGFLLFLARRGSMYQCTHPSSHPGSLPDLIHQEIQHVYPYDTSGRQHKPNT